MSLDMDSERRMAEFKLKASTTAVEIGLTDDELLASLLNMAYFMHDRMRPRPKRELEEYAIDFAGQGEPLKVNWTSP